MEIKISPEKSRELKVGDVIGFKSQKERMEIRIIANDYIGNEKYYYAFDPVTGHISMKKSTLDKLSEAYLNLYGSYTLYNKSELSLFEPMIVSQ